MALSTEAAAVNTAVDVLIAAWEAYVDSLTQGDQILVVPIRRRQSTIGAGERWGNDAATIQWDTANRFVFTRTSTVADRFPTQVGNLPLFFKLTNASRELT